MQAAADDLIGREIGGYRVEALLGVGGMGRVYRAEQQRLRRTVAFKVVRGEHARDSTFRERLLLEAYTAARVEHPNVVTIYDAGEADDLLYIAMQLVSGGDLHRLSRAGAVGLREAIEVGAAVSRALQAAWNEGIVHLDIKPANILRATDGTWKVADFGLARSVGAALVDPAKASADDVDEEELGLCGTPAYMALEQWEGRRPDVRTDLYALGVTLFQLLGGEHPLEVEHGAAPFAYYERLRRGRRRPLGPRAPEAPRPLVELIEQLLERDPDRRPRSAVVVAQLFERILAGLDRTDFNVPVTRAHTHGLAAELSPGQVGTAGTSAGAPEAAPGQGASSRASRGREAPLRGRIAEVELLRQRVRALLEGGGGALAFRGVRGVGRTRVLRVAGSLARSHGLRAIGGRARPRQAASALRDLLLDLLRNEDPAAGESLSLARTRRELERATENGLDIVLAALPEGSADARSILRPLLLGQPLRSDGPGLPARALGGLLAHYATSTRPLIVALDGLEHACGATLSVAACLREAARNKPILLLMSALDGPVGDDALARVTEVGEVEQHTVQPLDDEAMHAIVADALGRKPHEVSGPALEAIVRVARGLPKIAVATVKNGLRLSRLALREGRLEVESLANLESLASAIADRLAKTSPRAPAGAPSSARPPALPPNLAGQVRYYERRIAQALRLRSFHDHRGAIAALEAVVGSKAPEGRAGAAWVTAQLEFGRSLRLGGQRLEEAAGLLEDAAQWAEEHGQPEAAVDAGIEGALCRYLLREYEAAARSLDVAETRLARLRTDGGRAPMTGPCLEVELEHTRGLILARAEGGDLTDALQAFERALRLAAGLGDPGRFARVAQSVGETQRRGGRLDAADRYIRLAVRYKERRGDLAGLAVAYGGLGRVALGRGEREEAARWFRRDLELSLRIGDWRGAGVAGNALGEIHEETYLEGQNPADRVRARAAYDKAREAAGRSGNRIDHAISLFYRGRFLSRAGDEPDRYFGLAELEEGLRIFRELGRDLEARKVENALAVARSGLASGGDP